MLITRYGLPQAALYPLGIAAVMGGLWALAGGGPGWAWLGPAEAALAALLLWALSFFRDPPRKLLLDDACLVSPADGTVTDAAFVPASPLGGAPLGGAPLGGDAVKIGIFLSVFNTHINRAPCRAVVEAVDYRRGAKHSALSPEAGRVNESNNLFLRRLAGPDAGGRLLVRQISGAIARRIVCEAAPGTELAQGQPFGMIKFGSRTELYAASAPPGAPGALEITVRPGDKVKAGLTVLARYTRG